MFVVTCPAVATPRGERLVSESRIRSLSAVPGGFTVTVDCPCGQLHEVLVLRTEEEVGGRAQVVG